MDTNLGQRDSETQGEVASGAVKSLARCPRLAQRVLALAFLPTGGLVTCGERHLKLWDLPATSAAPPAEGAAEPQTRAAAAPSPSVLDLKGRPAAVGEAHRGETFVDVVCGGDRCPF